MINGWADVLQLITFDDSSASATIENLPINNGQVRVRVHTKHGDWWARNEAKIVTDIP
jgi:hypothetical protein